MKFKNLFIIILSIFFVSFLGCSKKNTNINQNTTKDVSAEVSVNSTNEKNEANKDIENDEVTSNKNNIPVQNNTPIQNKKTVVIDPGHGNRSNLEKEKVSPQSNELKIKDGGGAEGVATKVPEHVVNMKVSMKLKALLEKKGYNVVMTKTKNEESPGNIERAEIGNKNNAALVVRIHADSSDNQAIRGASLLVPASIGNAVNISKISKQYGEIVLASLTEKVGMKNRGMVERNDLTGFNWSKVPVILVEMGFLSNSEEDKLLNNEDYEDKIADALCVGIEKALN